MQTLTRIYQARKHNNINKEEKSEKAKKYRAKNKLKYREYHINSRKTTKELNKLLHIEPNDTKTKLWNNMTAKDQISEMMRIVDDEYK